MKAMILAAGFGTRLGALTQSTPKCLMPIGTSTLLEQVVERVKLAGVTEIVINLHYLAEQVRAYVDSKKGFGLKTHFSFEPEILGTGGGLKKAQSFFSDEKAFIVYNADVFCELDLATVAQAHSDADALATLVVMKRPTERALLFDHESKLVGWENKDPQKSEILRPGDRFGFTGIQVLSPKIFSFMSNESGSFSSIKSYMLAARAGEKVLGFDLGKTYWADAGTPEKLAEVRDRALKARS